MKRLKSFPIRPEDSQRIKIYTARRGISAQKFHTECVCRFLSSTNDEQVKLLKSDVGLHDDTLKDIRQTFVIDDEVHIALNIKAASHMVSVGKMIRSIITTAINNECYR